jgi:predicted DsbA family dithiol-disulfide isomerase
MDRAMTLDIDVVSDFVCPWCFLGKVRLDKALAGFRRDRPGVEVRVNWLPFFLNPNTPPEGEPYRRFLEAKFGGARGADEVQQRVAQAAAPDGLQFAFDRIATRPNTLAAHRLCYRAQSQGDRPERVKQLVDLLFEGYFQNGRDIGDIETLADMAAACGDRREAVIAYLESDQDVNAVRRMAGQIHRQGITGVPFFIMNRSLGLSGAQSEAVLGAALLQASEGPLG